MMRPGSWRAIVGCAVFLLAPTATLADADTRLLAAARSEQQATLDTLKDLVAFDSGSLNGDGVRKVADIAEARLNAIGFATERVDARPSPGVNVVGRWNGTGTKRLLLLAHMDTVYLDGTATKQPFRAGARRLVRLAQAIYTEIGLPLHESEGGGGGTDAAYAGEACDAVVESMGMPGAGAHANSEEYVLVDRIPERLYLAAELIKRASSAKE